jgi:SAM-dependent methyltransferase
MDFKALQEHWNTKGAKDPLWAILSSPDKAGGKWNIAEFFQSGEKEITAVIKYLDGLHPLRRERALDFGCGVGRLTQALAEHFEEVAGVDVASSMIERAREFNQHDDRCRYFLNEANHLALFESGSFSFVYSNLVLQHMHPRYSIAYMREFVRLLEPGGIALFQAPSDANPAGVKAGEGGQMEGELQAQGFAAEVQPVNPPSSVESGTDFAVRVRVKNKSPLSWPVWGREDGGFQLKLAARWLDAKGNTVEDYGRSMLPRTCPPGQTTELRMHLSAPAETGSYILEIDMMQEGIGRFQDKGSAPSRMAIQAVAERPKTGDEAARELKAPMHAVPRAVVTQLLTDSGVRILDVQPHTGAGPNWISYCYCVLKA